MTKPASRGFGEWAESYTDEPYEDRHMPESMWQLELKNPAWCLIYAVVIVATIAASALWPEGFFPW